MGPKRGFIWGKFGDLRRKRAKGVYIDPPEFQDFQNRRLGRKFGNFGRFRTIIYWPRAKNFWNCIENDAISGHFWSKIGPKSGRFWPKRERVSGVGAKMGTKIGGYFGPFLATYGRQYPHFWVKNGVFFRFSATKPSSRRPSRECTGVHSPSAWPLGRPRPRGRRSPLRSDRRHTGTSSNF